MTDVRAEPTPAAPSQPLVSVVVPALNEESTIERALAPLLADPLGDAIEVIVAVGPSRDRTREVVAGLAAADRRVRLVDNPGRITSLGLNAAIRAARGDVIARMDGHAEPQPGYLSACLRVLQASGAWNVGGRIRKVGESRAARAVAAATSSPFGIGGGRRFHLLDSAEDVDTLWPGFWPRWVFERVGLFDPEMVQNQDDDLNQRIVDAGGRIRFDPSISVDYRNRGTFTGLLRQYSRYGMYKVRGIQKRPAILRLRHLVPAAIVGAAAVLVLAAVIWPAALVVLGGAAVAWLALAVGFASRVAGPYGASVPDVVTAYACLHVGYGAGMWMGLVRFAPRWLRDRVGAIPRLEPRSPAPAERPAVGSADRPIPAQR